MVSVFPETIPAPASQVPEQVPGPGTHSILQILDELPFRKRLLGAAMLTLFVFTVTLDRFINAGLAACQASLGTMPTHRHDAVHHDVLRRGRSERRIGAYGKISLRCATVIECVLVHGPGHGRLQHCVGRPGRQVCQVRIFEYACIEPLTICRKQLCLIGSLVYLPLPIISSFAGVSGIARLHAER